MKDTDPVELAKIGLKSGNEHPFDADWDNNPVPDIDDWAKRAARGVIADLQDRRGIKHGFDGIHLDTRQEIVETLAHIIRLAAEETKPKKRRGFAWLRWWWSR